MKKYMLYAALPLAILSACNSGPSAAEQKETLQNEVMAIHDEAMARMGEIYKLRRELRSLRDTLEQQPQADSTRLQHLQQELSALNQADEVMMQWMRQYKAPDSLEHTAAMDYLQQELTKVKRVQHVMDSTLEAAHNTLNNYEQEK